MRSARRFWTLHDIRRTMATGLASAKISHLVVELLLNHNAASLSGVAAVYRHDYLDEKREAVDRWPAIVMLSTLVSVKSDRPMRPGFVRLAEDHVLLGTMQRPPRIDAPLQRAANVRVQRGMPSAQLVEHADHPDAGRAFEDRHDLRFPVRLQRIGSPPPSWCRLLRRQPWIVLDPVGGRGRNPQHPQTGSRRARQACVTCRNVGGRCLSYTYQFNESEAMGGWTRIRRET